MDDGTPFCASMPNGARCHTFAVAVPSGTVMEQIASARDGGTINAIHSINTVTSLGADGELQNIRQSPQGEGGESTQVSACKGGYVGFNYWADVDSSGQETTVRGLQFLCRTDSGLQPSTLLGNTGPNAMTVKKNGVLCPQGQGLVVFRGNYVSNAGGVTGTTGTTGATGATGPIATEGWWWNIDQDSLDPALACGAIGPTGPVVGPGPVVQPIGLSALEIGLIVLGAIIVLIILALLVWFFFIHREPDRPSDPVTLIPPTHVTHVVTPQSYTTIS